MENFEKLHKIIISTENTRGYNVRHVAEISHKGLGTYRILKDSERGLLNNKVIAQFFKWDEQYLKTIKRNKSLSDREANQTLADERTNEARSKILAVENILQHTLGVDDTVDWRKLKDRSRFKTPNPQALKPKELSEIQDPIKPNYQNFPEKPNTSAFEPQFSFLDKLFKSRTQKKKSEAEMLFQSALVQWEKLTKKCEKFNIRLDSQYEKQMLLAVAQRAQLEKKYEDLEKDWELAKKEYHKIQDEFNAKVDDLKKLYHLKEVNAVLEYCELVLNNSEYPEEFPKDFDLEYNPSNNLLVIDYVLPPPEVFPKLSEVKYVTTKKELKEYYISDMQLSKTFDTAIYKICLRTIHEIFEADKAGAIDLLVFNGWVESINKATGKRTNNCIITVQVTKSEFIKIDLANVDPKICFKSIKGVGSSKLSGITAVQPLMQISRDDKRFVSSYDVANILDEGYNLAVMSWEDFEHLIRELFEKEFSSNGGEVKVTQASRDGGVDAIAFDPDPIRGGKIVIQAKRYTNTVGVSAVRDLYGTVLNEGATKGILVSTADYGPDAYEFAKNKPLTLMNGSNLLYLLEKHGHKARIDLAEAKRIQAGII